MEASVLLVYVRAVDSSLNQASLIPLRFFFWVTGLMVALGVLGVFAAAGFFGSDAGACLPDDSFGLRPQDFSYWGSSGFFQITLGFGDLTFTQAKAIDIVWDVVSCPLLAPCFAHSGLI